MSRNKFFADYQFFGREEYVSTINEYEWNAALLSNNQKTSDSLWLTYTVGNFMPQMVPVVYIHKYQGKRKFDELICQSCMRSSRKRGRCVHEETFRQELRQEEDCDNQEVEGKELDNGSVSHDTLSTTSNIPAIRKYM